MKVAKAELDGDAAVIPGGQCGNRAEARLVEDFERDDFPRRGEESAALRLCVAGGLIVQARLTVQTERFPVQGFVFGGAECAAVDEHRARGGRLEPAAVEGTFRFAGAEKMPLPFAQGLNPCVVVVAVRPARHIHLPGGEPDAAQRGDQERGFLAAAAAAAGKHGDRCGRARVLRLVARVFVAPAVDFEYGLRFAFAAHTVPQKRKEAFPVRQKGFVVDARADDVLEIGLFGQRAAPRNMFAQPPGVGGAGFEKGCGVLRPIFGQRRFEIRKFGCLIHRPKASFS